MNVRRGILHSAGLLSAVLLATVAARGNAIPNSSFTSAGATPIGTPFSIGPGGGASAAADWYTFVPDPSSIATSELLASTDNLSGNIGNMLSFSTNAGFNGSAGNGLFTIFSVLPAGTTGYMDINVPTGTSGEIGFVCSDGAFCPGSYAFGATSGWQRVSFSTTGATDEFGFEIFSAGGGSMLVADAAAPTPEPSTLLLLASGLPLIGFVRRKFARGNSLNGFDI